MKQKLYQLLVPGFIKEKLYQMNIRQYQLEEARRREIVEQEFLPVELSPVYIQHLKVVANLNELIRMMPGNARVAEVGAGRGALSETLLTISYPSKLFLIDHWVKSPDQNGLLDIVQNKFKEEIQTGVVEIFSGDPIAELAKITDESLDWIFIKSDNSYQHAFSLLETSRKKVNTNGIIAGCSYSIGHWMSMQRFGVIEAVNKFCKEYGWEMIYLTNESNRQLNYALKKITLKGSH